MMKQNHLTNTLRDGEHIGPDGRIYCDVCGKPRQTLLTFYDPPKLIPSNCDCMKNAYEQRHDKLRDQERLDKIKRLKAAIADPALLKQTFEASKYDTYALRIARQYASQWPQGEKGELGLLLWGPAGTGKTYLAASIANALLDRAIPVMITSLGKMLGALPNANSGERSAVIDQWTDYPLLVIDDLGVERDTPYVLETVYQIIDSRYRKGKPMVITTNLTREEMDHPDSLEKQRIYQRILERCASVRVNEIPIRQLEQEKNMTIARKTLHGTDSPPAA